VRIRGDGLSTRGLREEFAGVLVRGATQPVSAKREAEKVWEPKFIGEIVSGRNPRKRPAPPVAEGMTVADFLDQYYERYVVAEYSAEHRVDSQSSFRHERGARHTARERVGAHRHE
jgi:hypothetical protein